MVGLRKLMKAVSTVLRACASALITMSLTLMRLAERIEKRSSFK